MEENEALSGAALVVQTRNAIRGRLGHRSRTGAGRRRIRQRRPHRRLPVPRRGLTSAQPRASLPQTQGSDGPHEGNRCPREGTNILPSPAPSVGEWP